MAQAILVGVDGSDSALHATRWAAHEAVRRHTPLHLFHACVLPPLGPHVTAATEAGVTETLIEQGHQWLRLAKGVAWEAEPGVEVRTELRVGLAAGELIGESAHALLVVLGSRGLGGFKGMLVGSVSSGVAAHGHCPVVVVRGRLPGDAPPEGGPVVVGVDGSEVSDSAVAFAFEEASLRNVPLVAVHTWIDVSVAETWSALPFDVDWEAVAEDERRLLAERMAGWQEKYPEVEVRQRVVRDRPVRGLLGEAGDAQLIVVGSRGRGAFKGMGLGSTSQALLHHSECPVAVVRPSGVAHGRETAS
ncbi:universal stress protein [Amycolatopsis alkalitolerans]|uniref:Universal stress protein n=1 Tax=Amycolatopsis alkalitolerans TaxID=2547244 RepID=A0A5C4LVQ1_9PSEU|nr:universal stress protein [Amycolatopsis alkalitolerans]TNC21836.1 universal stress protein [Amycolatopsis alkalitolerans]